MTELFLSYWKDHTSLIDYLLIDYYIYIINEKVMASCKMKLKQ